MRAMIATSLEAHLQATEVPLDASCTSVPTGLTSVVISVHDALFPGQYALPASLHLKVEAACRSAVSPLFSESGSGLQLLLLSDTPTSSSPPKVATTALKHAARCFQNASPSCHALKQPDHNM